MRIPTLLFDSSNIDAITLRWEGSPAEQFILDWRHINSTCEGNRNVRWLAPDYPNIEIIEGLRPGSAYLFRLTVIADGKAIGPGPEFTFYTQANESCCTIS